MTHNNQIKQVALRAPKIKAVMWTMNADRSKGPNVRAG